MGVAGVATATVISQYLSGGLILLCLTRTEGVCHIELRQLRFYKDKLKRMLQTGLPAGLQGVIFNIANVLIQSSVNSFGATVVAGNAAASNLEGFVYISMNALYQTCLSFTSQNLGAQKFRRIDQVLVRCVLIVSVIGWCWQRRPPIGKSPALHLLQRSRGHLLWHDPPFSGSGDLFPVRRHGSCLGQCARVGVFCVTHPGLPGWGLSVPHYLDFYCLPAFPHAARSLSLLAHFLGANGKRALDLLLNHSAKSL